MPSVCAVCAWLLPRWKVLLVLFTCSFSVNRNLKEEEEEEKEIADTFWWCSRIGKTVHCRTDHSNRINTAVFDRQDTPTVLVLSPPQTFLVQHRCNAISRVTYIWRGCPICQTSNHGFKMDPNTFNFPTKHNCWMNFTTTLLSPSMPSVLVFILAPLVLGVEKVGVRVASEVSVKCRLLWAEHLSVCLSVEDVRVSEWQQRNPYRP